MAIKKISFGLLLLGSALVACDDEDVAPGFIPPDLIILPDTVAPEVAILTPEANDSLLVIDVIEILADITDNRNLDSVRVVLTEPGGTSWVLSDTPLRLNGNFQEYQLSQRHLIPQYAAAGDYTVRVEAKDIGQNVTKDSVTFTVHASDVSSAAFTKPFSNGLLHSNLQATLGWYGYNAWDAAYSFENSWFSMAMYLMVSTDQEYSISEAEWNKFVADFDVKNQSWTKWDENSDGNLNDAEFDKGLSSLNLFRDWDKNQDKKVSYEEMADGIFERWDRNKDGFLSKEEYQEKFYTYLFH